MFETVRAIRKLFCFAMMCIIAVIVQPPALLLFKGKYAYHMTPLWHKILCKIFNIKVIINGQTERHAQTLFVSNHVSYLDIPVLASTIPASFIAKQEVKSWPVLGILATLQQTVFISRDKHNALAGQQAINNILQNKTNLILFPEGTSTDGTTVYPFKSSLFSLAFQENTEKLFIQPVTLNIIEINHKQIKLQQDRDLYAWHINMDIPLAKHLWGFAKSSGAVISLDLHPVIQPKAFSNRKTLAKHCHNTVSNGLKI